MRLRLIALPLLASACLLGCAPKGVPWSSGGDAQAVLRPLRGGYGTGTLTLEPKGRLVRISGTIEGLAPGVHGLHIHARADCAGQAANPADPHFNPTGKRHGDPSRPERHAGDLPMLVAGQNGQARYDVLLDGLKLTSGPDGVLGRAVVVKAGPDDHTTQPGGNAGPGVACGVIERR